MKSIGIELGSTRIKSVVLGDERNVVRSGSHTWENKLEDGLWTYSLSDVWRGLENCVAQIGDTSDTDVIGISAMMHGYLVFDENDNLLTPFRTWRCENTGKAAKALTELFNFNIPLRWSVAHLYQAILNGEAHVGKVAFITTLAGYVHWKLTGEKVLGIDDASGMFPVKDGDWNMAFVMQFKELTGIDWVSIAPKILSAGEPAGNTVDGNPLGLPGGIPLCPPEGDAGTGMVATNAIALRTGNVSAGTSIFAMIVLEKALSKPYPLIDIVSTPDGKDVAMVHCNECTIRVDPWIKLFGEAIELFGFRVDTSELFTKLYEISVGGAGGDDARGDNCGLGDCGSKSDDDSAGASGDAGDGGSKSDDDSASASSDAGAGGSKNDDDSAGVGAGDGGSAGGGSGLAAFMRERLESAVVDLEEGIKILTDNENVRIDKLAGHGGFFKSGTAGRIVMSEKLGIPIEISETASEGGAWGIALLADYMRHADSMTLDEYLC